MGSSEGETVQMGMEAPGQVDDVVKGKAALNADGGVSDEELIRNETAAVEVQRVFRGHRARRTIADAATLANKFGWYAFLRFLAPVNDSSCRKFGKSGCCSVHPHRMGSDWRSSAHADSSVGICGVDFMFVSWVSMSAISRNQKYYTGAGDQEMLSVEVIGHSNHGLRR